MKRVGPRNESELHWRLKRIGRRILWYRGCWAVAPEMTVGDSASHTGSGERNYATADLVGIGPLSKRRPLTEAEMEKELENARRFGWAFEPQQTKTCRTLGIFVAECKASLGDLRAGFVAKGGHLHYVIVPAELKDDALRLAPKHVGIVPVTFNQGGEGDWKHWDYRFMRGARRQSEADLPLWDIQAEAEPPPGWGRFLLSLAGCSTRWGLRWQI